MSIFKSRQIVTALIDALVGIVALLLPRFASAADAELVRGSWIACQPLVAALILKFTTDDQTRTLQAPEE